MEKTTDTTPRAWVGCLSEVDDSLRPALCAWVESGDYVAEGTGDLPSISDFEERYCGAWENRYCGHWEERYCGHWDSFREYADQLADDIGLLDGVPEEIARYFDWQAWSRDLAFDYSTYDDPKGGVFVFRVL